MAHAARPLHLLCLLALGACEPMPDKGDVGGGGAGSGVDTAAGDSGLAPSASCAVLGLAPLSTSWSGGEELVVTLDCADPALVDAATTTLDLRDAELRVDASSTVRAAAESVAATGVTVVDESTAEVTFTAPVQPGAGLRDFDLTVGGDVLAGDILRFGFDAADLGRLLPDQDAGLEAVGETLPLTVASAVLSIEGTTEDSPLEPVETSAAAATTATTETGATLLTLSDGVDGGVVYTRVVSRRLPVRGRRTHTNRGNPVGPRRIPTKKRSLATGGGDGTGGPTVVSAVDLRFIAEPASGPELSLVLFSDDGTSLSKGGASLTRAQLSEAAGTALDLTDATIRDITYDAETAEAVTGGLTLLLDAQDVDGNWLLVKLAGSVTDPGTGDAEVSLSRVWSVSLAASPVHVSREAQVGLVSGYGVFTQQGDDVHGAWITADGGKVEGEVSWKELGPVYDLSSLAADLDDSGADELVLAAVNGDGAVSTARWDLAKGAAGLSVSEQAALATRLPVELRWSQGADGSLRLDAARGIIGQEDDGVHTTTFNSIMKSPSLGSDPTATGYTSVQWPYQLKLTSVQYPFRLSGPGATASWASPAEGGDVTGVPDAVDVGSPVCTPLVDGGGPTARQTHVCGHSGITRTLQPEAESEERLPMASLDGWVVFAQDGQAWVRDPSGTVSGRPLPLDPTSSIQLGLTSRESDRDTLVVLGSILSVDADGLASRQLAVVTEGPGGQGLATADDGGGLDGLLQETEDSVLVNDNPIFGGGGGGTSVLMRGSDADGNRTTLVGWLDLSLLPAGGEEGTVPLSIAAWPVTMAASADGAATPPLAVALSPERRESLQPDGSPLADAPGVSTVAEVSGSAALPDLFVTLPDGDGVGCPFATYYLPGDTTSPAENLALAVPVATSSRTDCADLAVPTVAYDPRGTGRNNTVVLSRMAARETEPAESVTISAVIDLTYSTSARSVLVATPPTLLDTPISAFAATDLDGDGLEELLITVPTTTDAEGAVASAASAVALERWGDDALARCTLTADEITASAAGLTGETVEGAALAHATCTEATVLAGTREGLVVGASLSGDTDTLIEKDLEEQRQEILKNLERG